MVKCIRYAQNSTCEMGLLWETRDHILDECSVMHIRPIYKLATKLSKIKNQSQRHKSPPKPKQKKYTKIENLKKNSQKYTQKGI